MKYLLFRVGRFGLLFEVVAAVFSVSDPDLEFSADHSSIRDSISWTGSNRHDHSDDAFLLGLHTLCYIQ